MEQRLDTFSTDAGRKTDSLTQSVAASAGKLQDEVSGKLVEFKNSTERTLAGISQVLKNELQDLKMTVDRRLSNLQVENEKKLEQMRQTVDEKLQGTLEARLGESFKQVSDHLEQVYKGLGEMQTLAAGVGDLKRVLTKPREGRPATRIKKGRTRISRMTLETRWSQVVRRPCPQQRISEVQPTFRAHRRSWNYVNPSPAVHLTSRHS